MTRKELDRKQFTQAVLQPDSRFTIMSITIYQDGKFNMNGKLSEKLGGKKLRIFFTADAKNLILEEDQTYCNSIQFPKNGSKQIPSALEIVKRGKLPLPAKYEVWLTNNGGWQGDYIENPTLLPSKRPPNSKKH